MILIESLVQCCSCHISLGAKKHSNTKKKKENPHHIITSILSQLYMNFKRRQQTKREKSFHCRCSGWAHDRTHNKMCLDKYLLNIFPTQNYTVNFHLCYNFCCLIFVHAAYFSFIFFLIAFLPSSSLSSSTYEYTTCTKVQIPV